MKLKLIFSILVGSMLIMLSHGFIPHHHHSHSIISHNENGCPSESEPEEENHKAPFHCHAFNDTDWFNQDQDNRNESVKAVILFAFNFTREVPPITKPNFENREIRILINEYFNYYSSRPPPVLS